MILGYLRLNSFSDIQYDHRLAGISAAASAVAFLLPALFISQPIRQILTMTPRSFDRPLICILILSTATIAVGASYNFRLVSLHDMYEYRAKVVAPAIPNYLITIVSSALLPFAFAGFVTRKAYWRSPGVHSVQINAVESSFRKVKIAFAIQQKQRIGKISELD
jgi:hypothetical protein